MYSKHPDKLKSLFPKYNKKEVWESLYKLKYAPPASFWIKKTRYNTRVGREVITEGDRIGAIKL